MKVILVSHGSFSKGLFETMEMVLGEQQNLSYVGLYPHQGVDILKENIEKEFTKADEGEEILVLTDLFYGSPFNAVVQLMNSYDVNRNQCSPANGNPTDERKRKKRCGNM